MKKAPEHGLQVFIINYLRHNGVFCFAVPNGGRRDAKTGAMLKKEGVLAGVSDLIVLLPDGETVFVELKDGTKGRQSDSQVWFEHIVRKLGFTYLLWRKPEDAMAFVKGLKGLNNGGVGVRPYPSVDSTAAFEKGQING